jgi:RNA polymerase-binding transcription factor DksA
MCMSDKISTFREQLERHLADLEMRASEIRTGLRDGLIRERRRVQAALQRMREGSYGFCCACRDELTPKRLLADPAAPFCMDCEVDVRERSRGRSFR